MARPTSILPRPLAALWVAFVVLSILLYLLAISHRSLTLQHVPYSLFRFRFFEDLIVYAFTFHYLHTAQFFDPDPYSRFAYPAGAAIVYRLFYAFHRLKVGYVATCLAWTLVIVAGVTRALRQRGIRPALAVAIALSGLLCFPYLFLIQRGNIEIVLWILSTFGIVAYARHRPYLAAVLWGLAACIKIYPILFLALFLSRRLRLGPILAGIASALLGTLAALWYVGPTIPIALRGFAGGVQGFQGNYAQTIRVTEIGYDHSLLSDIKLWAVAHGHAPGSGLHTYYLVAGTVASLVFLLRVRKLPFLNRLLFVTVAFVLLPPVSYEYTLVHLYLPAALLLFYGVQIQPLRQAPRQLLSPGSPTLPSLTAALVCMLLLFLPINLYTVNGLLFAGQFQTLPLLLLAILAAVTPWPTPHGRPSHDAIPPGTAAVAAA